MPSSAPRRPNSRVRQVLRPRFAVCAAEHRVISVRTVDNALQHVYGELGLRSRTELRTALRQSDPRIPAQDSSKAERWPRKTSSPLLATYRWSGAIVPGWTEPQPSSSSRGLMPGPFNCETPVSVMRSSLHAWGSKPRRWIRSCVWPSPNSEPFSPRITGPSRRKGLTVAISLTLTTATIAIDGYEPLSDFRSLVNLRMCVSRSGRLIITSALVRRPRPSLAWTCHA